MNNGHSWTVSLAVVGLAIVLGINLSVPEVHISPSVPSGLMGVAYAAPLVVQGDPVHDVLPRDAIPAIDNPRFVAAAQAKLADDASVIAVSRGGEHHVYSLYLLNAHEIVNDVVGGEPLATTW